MGHHMIRKTCRLDLRLKQDDGEEGGGGAERLIFGLASTFEPPERADSFNEIIAPGAFLDSLERHFATLKETGRHTIKFLWQHFEPLGVPIEMAETEDGLEVSARVSKTSLGDDALQLANDGAVDSLSIGFFPIRWEVDETVLDDWGFPLVRHLEVELVEFSLVTFPANPFANVSDVKSIRKHRRLAGYTSDAGRRNGVLQHKSVVPHEFHTLLDVDEPWDEAAEREAADVDTLEDMALWFDEESPEDKESYLWLHHRAEDLWTNWRAVQESMGLFLSANTSDMMTDDERRLAYDHLAEHYDEFDEVPPEFRAEPWDPEELREAGFTVEAAAATAALEADVSGDDEDATDLDSLEDPDTPDQKGEALATLLNDAIDAAIEAEEGLDRDALVSELVGESGMVESEVESVLSGETCLLNLNEVEAFASVLDLTTEAILAAMESDGCALDGPDEDAAEDDDEEKAAADAPTCTCGKAAKSGRVLSAKNFDTLNKAVELITDVLNSASPIEDDQKARPQKAGRHAGSDAVHDDQDESALDVLRSTVRWIKGIFEDDDDQAADSDDVFGDGLDEVDLSEGSDRSEGPSEALEIVKRMALEAASLTNNGG